MQVASPAVIDALAAALLIFSMRVTDVTIGTLRIVFLVRGKRWTAGMLGFFESLVWVLAARLVLTDLDDPIKIIGFAAGFGAGTVLGGTIERWLALGNKLIRIVAPVESPAGFETLREAGYQVTVLNGEGRDGDVRIAFSVIPRRKTSEVLSIVRENNPEAFVTLEDATLPNMKALRSSTAVRK